MGLGVPAGSFIADVETVDPPPAIWSSIFLAFQPVTYRVVRALKGAPGATLTVFHLVVPRTRTANPNPARPGLSPDLFRPASG